MNTNTKTRNRVHFMASEYGSRAACGRQVLGWRDDAPRWSPKLDEVTCVSCRVAVSA